jgi:hypothetical protein
MGSRELYVVFQINQGLVPNTTREGASSGTNSQFWSELWATGVSCTGAVVSGVGVAGAVALAPETGGLSLPSAVLLWGGAAASAGQCAVGLYRFSNVVRDRDDLNESMDKNPEYRATMYVLDGVGLVGAGGAVKEIAETEAALKEAGATLDSAKLGRLSRQQRLTFTRGLEIEGTKRLANQTISKFVKQKLLDLTGAALGMTGSATVDGGVVHDVAIWVVRNPSD